MSESQNGHGVLFVGGLATILAFACCLGSLVLIALGFSGAWIGNLTVLGPYRPIFIGVTPVALFSTWRRIYHLAQICGSGEVCAIPQVRATCKLIFWVMTVLVLVTLGFPHVIPFFYWSEFTMEKPSTSLALAAVVAPVWAVTQSVTLSVSDMTCSACPITTEKTISKANGVSKVVVTLEARGTMVAFDDVRTGVQKLAKATRDMDYPSNVKQ